MIGTLPRSLEELNALIVASPPFVPGSSRAVLGEGPVGAAFALVGEQPGDWEDVEGKPFVGPAGKILSKALQKAGIERGSCYVTNAVKHFKYQQRGKRRIHQRPTQGEVRHYRWWLELELCFVSPRVVVAMGRTAASALLDRAVSIKEVRGPLMLAERRGFVTVHPSSLLRQVSAEERAIAYDAFVKDLQQVRQMAAQ